MWLPLTASSLRKLQMLFCGDPPPHAVFPFLRRQFHSALCCLRWLIITVNFIGVKTASVISKVLSSMILWEGVPPKG